MPEPKSMLEATSEANNLASLSEAKDYYTHGMESVCGGEKPYINEHVIEIEHLRIRDSAIEVFTSKRKMGGEEFSAKYREQVRDTSFWNYHDWFMLEVEARKPVQNLFVFLRLWNSVEEYYSFLVVFRKVGVWDYWS